MIDAPPNPSVSPRPTVAVIVPSNRPVSVTIGDLVADLEVDTIGRRLVDRQLVRADRWLALLQGDAGEAGFGDPRDAERRHLADVTASPSSSISWA